jgi:hypothetical protein
MNKISPVSILAGVAELAASAGAGLVVGNLVKATTPDNLSKVNKVLLVIGSYTIGGVLSDLSSMYARNKIEVYSEKVASVFRTPSEDSDEAVLVVTEESDAKEVVEEPKTKAAKPKTTKKDSE